MSRVGLYRWIKEREAEQWRKGVGCWRWSIDRRRPEPDYISSYWESMPRSYPQDPVSVALPPAAAKRSLFKSSRRVRPIPSSRFLKRK